MVKPKSRRRQQRQAQREDQEAEAAGGKEAQPASARAAGTASGSSAQASSLSDHLGALSLGYVYPAPDGTQIMRIQVPELPQTCHGCGDNGSGRGSHMQLHGDLSLLSSRMSRSADIRWGTA
jgi:hypothetical protein